MTIQDTGKAFAIFTLALLAAIGLYWAEIWISNFLGSLLASGQHLTVYSRML